MTLVRTVFVMMRVSLGYAYGYQGIGEKETAQYMLSKFWPQMAPIYGIVASLTFSSAYSVSNIMTSATSKNWNKKYMLIAGILGIGLSSMASGFTNSLLVFATLRVIFGAFSANINTPIYQLIATNFPPNKRSTANAIENGGYSLGAGLSSSMIYIISRFGWRAMYWTIGSFGLILAAFTALFVKNPDAPTEEDDSVKLKQLRVE